MARQEREAAQRQQQRQKQTPRPPQKQPKQPQQPSRLRRHAANSFKKKQQTPSQPHGKSNQSEGHATTTTLMELTTLSRSNQHSDGTKRVQAIIDALHFLPLSDLPYLQNNNNNGNNKKTSKHDRHALPRPRQPLQLQLHKFTDAAQMQANKKKSIREHNKTGATVQRIASFLFVPSPFFYLSPTSNSPYSEPTHLTLLHHAQSKLTFPHQSHARLFFLSCAFLSMLPTLTLLA